MTVTDVLAFWGAIVATGTAAWTIFRDSSDRGKIPVDASVGRMYPSHPDQDLLFVTITNVGRRPILVKSRGMKQRKTTAPYLFIVPHAFPRILNEAEYHAEWTHEMHNVTDDITHIWVLDSTGRY